MSDNLKLIILMMIVTYIPRLIPFYILSTEKLPEGVRRFLGFVPCTALGALIFPGAFSAMPDKPIASLVGIGFAAIYSWYKGGIIVPVLGGILLTFIILII